MPEGYRVVHELSDAHFEQVFAIYIQQWWTAGRSPQDVRAAFANSTALVALVDEATDEAVAFARVVSDGYFQATVNDVICRPDLRGRGLGAMLMEALLAHPAIARIPRLDLTCLPEMDGFYARFGFGLSPNGSHMLRRGPVFSPPAAG